MENRILLQKLKDIFLKYSYDNAPGLLVGNGGIVLFLAHYYKYVEQDKMIFERIEFLLENSLSYFFKYKIDDNISIGTSGLIWLINHLISLEILESDSLEIAELLSDKLFATASKDIDDLKIDFISGFTGKFEALKILNKTEELQIIKNQINNLCRDFYFSNFSILIEKNKFIDLGFAHGLPNFILFIAANNINNQIIDKYFDLILKTYNAKSIFNSNIPIRILNPTQNDVEFSNRFGWCYGDLGIIYSMVRLLKLNNYKKALSIFDFLKRNVNNINLESSGVNYFNSINCFDIGFCHGLSGIYHLLKEVNLIMKSQVVENLSYWENLLVDNIGKMINVVELSGSASYQNQDILGLLNGLSGAGLVLLTKSSKDSSWDNIFTIPSI